MKTNIRQSNFRAFAAPRIAPAIAALAAFLSCSKSGPVAYQGYVEGEFVYIAPGIGGRLERLLVQRGATIAANAPLMQLEAIQETAAVRQAEESLAAAKAQLADIGTGKRTTEIEVTKAQLEQAVAAESQSSSQLARDQAQFEAGGISRAELEASRAKNDVNAARTRELRSQVQVAELPGRPEQIRAQTSQVAAAEAAAEQARWRLDQKHVAAAQGGVVVDTLFREGEWVPAGSPVVRMLPPQNIKIRFFVPQPVLTHFPVGQKVNIRIDGQVAPVAAKVTYVATEPEFTPPIIYSNENRAKLVFMIEAHPALEHASSLRPGQPVEVSAP
jgi:HlyD family secretion protein